MSYFFCYYLPFDLSADASWAISYVTDDENEKIQAVIDAGCVPHLVKLLEMEENLIIVPALRSVGNIVTGSDSQTDAVLQCGLLKHMKKLLTNQRNSIVKEAAWTISNITAGSPAQIQAVIDAGIFEAIVKVLENGDFRSQKEAAWVITNTTSSGGPEQIVYLLERVGVLTPFCNLLDSKDARTVVVVLNGLRNLFQLAEKLGGIESLAHAIEECGALNKLEALQAHENDEVYKHAYQLIDSYFQDGVSTHQFLLFRSLPINSRAAVDYSCITLLCCYFIIHRAKTRNWHRNLMAQRFNSTRTTPPTADSHFSALLFNHFFFCSILFSFHARGDPHPYYCFL